MIFGYQNYISSFLNSFIFSLLLYFGCCFLGYFLIRLKIFSEIKLNNSFYLHSPLIFLNLLILILFPLVNLKILNISLLNYVSKFILLFGFLSIFFFFHKLKYIAAKLKFMMAKNYKILLFLVVVYFMLSLAPITHADSLAYHLNTAVHLLNYGSFFHDIIPIEPQTSGGGEILIALGLSQGAFQFANLIQISGIFSLISIFFNIKSKFLGKQNIYLLLSIITTPLFIFFISSPKPQILAAVNVLWVFSIIFIFFKRLNKKRLVFFYTFVCLILTVNFITKFSFILSSIILLIYSSYFLLKKKLYLQIFIIPLIIFLIFLFPSFLFKHHYYDISLLDFFKSPIPINIYGYENVVSVIKGPAIFPSWIIFPKNLTDISTIIGPVFLTFFLINLTDLKKKCFFFLIIFFYITIQIIFGSSSSRFIFDSFLVLQFILIFCKFNSKILFKYFKIYVISQTFISLIVTSYFIIRLLPGSINNFYYEKIMLKNANGYELISWVNKVLKKEDKLISTHRSISLFNVEAYEYWPLEYINFNNSESTIYINFIKQKKINRILFYNNNQEQNIFKNCIGKLISSKNKAGRHVGRNPLTKKNYYNADLYELKYNLMPNCIITR